MNGGSSASYLACTLCIPLFCALFNRGEKKRAFRLTGKGGDHFHCTVELRPVIVGVDKLRPRFQASFQTCFHNEKAMLRKRTPQTPVTPWGYRSNFGQKNFGLVSCSLEGDAWVSSFLGLLESQFQASDQMGKVWTPKKVGETSRKSAATQKSAVLPLFF